MNWLARIKAILAHHTLVIEFCHTCGRRVDQVWTASDYLWGEVTKPEPNTIRCVNCFDREARERGIFIRWIPKQEHPEGYV